MRAQPNTTSEQKSTTPSNSTSTSDCRHESSNDVSKIPSNCVEMTLSWPDTYFFLSSVMHSSMCFSLSDKSEFSFFDNIFSINSTCGPSTRFFNWIKLCASIAPGFDWFTRRSRRFYRGFKYFFRECSSFV